MELKIKAIQPLFTGLVTTMDKYEEDGKTGGLYDSKKLSGTIKEYQKVLAVGPMVTGIKVGDLVSINPKRYEVVKHEKGSLQDGVIKDNVVIGYNFPVIKINEEDCLLLQNNDIEFVITDYDFVEESPIIQVPQLIV